MLMLLLFATGLFAGTVDAIAGGGGLITIPVLLSIGMPPHLAFGTNKLQGTTGTLIAARRYHRHGLISFEKITLGIIFGLLGSIGGSITTQLISSDILKKLIPFLLLIIFTYTLFSPRLGHQDSQPKMQERWFYIIFGFVLGFYDGFFGPAVGSFWVFLFIFLLGYNLIKATAYTKVFNLNSSVIATFCFALGGNIDYRIGLCMALGQFFGGRLGATLAIHKGARLIRPLFLIIVAATIITLICKSYLTGEVLRHVLQQLNITLEIAVLMLFFAVIILSYRFINRHKTQDLN